MANIAVDVPRQIPALGGLRSNASELGPLMERIARGHAVSAMQQMRDIARLRLSKRKLSLSEYYDFGLYDPAMPMAEKLQYAGEVSSRALNKRLSSCQSEHSATVMHEKQSLLRLLQQNGLSVPRLEAIYGHVGSTGRVPVLRDSGALVTFLYQTAAFPLLAMPRKGRAAAAGRTNDCADRKTRYIDDAEAQNLSAWAKSVGEPTETGLFLMSVPRCHAAIRSVTDTSFTPVQIVTVANRGTPRTLYALWGISQHTHQQNHTSADNALIAGIDPSSGVVARCRSGCGPDARDMTHHPRTYSPIVGFKLPHWKATVQAAEAVHGQFPDAGICVHDIAISDNGPVVIDCHDNAPHALYQRAYERGIYNRDFAPIWEAAASLTVPGRHAL